MTIESLLYQVNTILCAFENICLSSQCISIVKRHSMFLADLQNVNITLRIIFRPIADALPNIYTNLGVDYDDRVLPSIVNEVLKAVVVS